MTRMPDFFAEVEHDLGHLFHRHDAPQQAAAPPIPHNVTQEVTPVSNALSDLDEIFGHVRAAGEKFAAIDRAALAKMAAIQATPEGSAAFDALHGLAQAEGASGVLAVVGGILKGLAALAPQPASIASDATPLAVPMGPVTGGVA